MSGLALRYLNFEALQVPSINWSAPRSMPGRKGQSIYEGAFAFFSLFFFGCAEYKVSM